MLDSIGTVERKPSYILSLNNQEIILLWSMLEILKLHHRKFIQMRMVRYLQSLIPDRIINMPISLLPEANMDLRKCLMDKAVPLAGSSLFFNGDISHLVNCMSDYKNLLRNNLVDFFDLKDRLYDKIKRRMN